MIVNNNDDDDDDNNQVEISGRVYNARNYILMDNTNLKTFKIYMEKCFNRVTSLRNQNSAVCTIIIDHHHH